MPNGGRDNCCHCLHLKAVQEMDKPHEKRKGWWQEMSFCTLRNVKITKFIETYCRNFDNYKYADRNKPVKPEGWILSAGLFEGYVRIPWNDMKEPRVDVSATCSICGRKTDEGIEIEHKGEVLGFCTNRHYIEWWVSVHHDTSFRPEDFEPPEERYKDRGKSVMTKAKTLGSSGKAVTFEYSGNVLDGVVIKYNYADVYVNRDFLNRILTTFRGKRILGGFSETEPTPDGFGEWVRDNSNYNSQPLTPRHASRIAAILVAEGYAESYRNGNAVIIKFSI